ncbi:MAG: hypothetical protein WB566_07465 [Terriglobales bacterium]
MMEKKQENQNDGEAFSQCRAVIESSGEGHREHINDFFQERKDEVGRQPAADEENPNPAVETSAGHAERLARARRGL